MNWRIPITYCCFKRTNLYLLNSIFFMKNNILTILLIWLSITFAFWWTIWSFPFLYNFTYLLWWSWIIFFLHEQRDKIEKSYKWTWMLIWTLIFIWYTFWTLLTWVVLPFLLALFYRISYVRAIQRKLTDWLWWWKTQLAKEELWFLFSCLVCFFVIGELWFSHTKTNYLVWTTVWFVLLLLWYFLLWHKLRTIKKNLLVSIFFFLWLITWLYSLLILVL